MGEFSSGHAAIDTNRLRLTSCTGANRRRTSLPDEGGTTENYDRGGGRSGASERLWYASSGASGMLVSSSVKPTSACSATRDGVPQLAIETQLNWQSVRCCVGDCDEGSAHSESPFACSIGEAVAAAADSCSPSQAHAGGTVIAWTKAMTATHAVMSRVLRSERRFAIIRRKPGRTGDYLNECRQEVEVRGGTPDICRGIPYWVPRNQCGCDGGAGRGHGCE